jgi:glycosyltransferase involved in cell wall biosynthesis
MVTPVRILLWHGYLLTGSGSNVYTANIAREWRAGGHDVLVLCQERHGLEQPYVDAAGEFGPDNRAVDLRETGVAAAAGRCVVVRPWIGSVLPVYVYDEYEGITAKRFVDLTDAELDDYTNRNVEAMVAAIEMHRPDAIVTGHEVMGPYIAREACARTGTTYLAKLHGSALEYAVKIQQRYKDYAVAGLSGASVVVGGSRYMVGEAASVAPGWFDKATVVNPGCDVELFRPVERTRPDVPVVGYVGKLIASKGVHDLLAALPLVRADLRAVIVGYGGFEDGLRALWDALHAGDRDRVAEIARAGEHGPLAALLALAESPPAGYFERASEMDVEFPGRLEHGPLSRTLPHFDVLVVPSVLAEAFGLVAAEAAACGVLPVVPGHSGIGEAGATLERRLGRPGLLTFDPGDPIHSCAAAIDRVLSIDFEERTALGRAACELARDRWTWTEVARRLLELALDPTTRSRES